MSCSGKITIFNEDSDVVFEKNLSPDEIIEALIADRGEDEEEQTEEETAPPSRRGRPKKQRVEAVHTEERGPVRPCCGAQWRGRHKSGCPEAPSSKPEATPGRNRRTVDGRHPFSEPTYLKVKQMREDGDGIDYIVSETGLDPQEVRRADLADDYDDYLKIA